MDHEIITKPITTGQLQSELEVLVCYFSTQRVTQCEIVYGRCSSHVCDAKEFMDKRRSLPVRRLLATFEQLKAEFNVELGDTDIFITVANHTFRFCSDKDLHMHYSEPNAHSDFFFDRWLELGYKPVEWMNARKGYAGEIVRHY
jgi:hypothetical protein